MFAEILRFKETGERMLQEDDVSPRATKPPFLSAILAKNDTTNLFGYKLGESSEKNKALLFFSGKKQFKLLTVPFKLLRCCLYGGPYLQTQQTILETQHNIFETQHKIIETQHDIIQTQHKIIETQHNIIQTQHKIVETKHNIIQTQHNIIQTQHKITETQHKIIETQHKNYRNTIINAKLICYYTTYNPIISQPLTSYAPN